MHMLKKSYGAVLVAASLAIGLVACGGGTDTTKADTSNVELKTAAEKVGSPSFNLQEAFKSQILLPGTSADFDLSGTYGSKKIIDGSATIATEDYLTGTFPSTTRLAYSKLSSIVVNFSTEADTVITQKSCFNSWYSMDYLPLGQEQQGIKVAGVCPKKPGDPTIVSFLPVDEFLVYSLPTNGSSALPIVAKGNQSGYVYDSAIRYGSSALNPQLGTIAKPTWEFVKPAAGSTDAQVIVKVQELDLLGKEQLVMTTTYNLDSKNILSIVKWEYIDRAKRFLLTKKQ